MRSIIVTALALVCAACVVAPPPPIAVAVAPSLNCRPFTSPVTINAQPSEATGEACQQPDGTWRVTQTTPGFAQPQAFIVPPPPADYYAYPYPWWGVVDIGLGGTVVFRGGTRVGAWRGGWHR